MSFVSSLKKWWLSLAFEPTDPRYGRGDINIVCIGGGTGLSTLLRGLKKYSKNITAIVAVSDTGKSSGVIRKVFKTLPPGDIRKCLAALSDEYQLLTEAFEYRFPKGSGFLEGHPLGNIWLAALIEKYNSFEKALEVSHHLLDTTGNVYPSTLDSVQLVAKYIDGKQITGEDKIPLYGKKIRKVIFNRIARPYKKSIEAIESADLIIIGPGSLYTSVIPNLLVAGINRAISRNNLATKVFIMNCSTERGETENMSATDHIDTISGYGSGLFDYALVNNKIIRRSKRQAELGEINNITFNESSYNGKRIIQADLINREKPLYHDQDKLAKEIILLYNSVNKPRSK